MECSILSEVDDTSFSGRGSPRRYGRPLNWLPASNLLPAQRAGAQRLCALALNGCAGLPPNISVVGGQPAVPAAVPDLLSLTQTRLFGPQGAAARIAWCATAAPSPSASSVDRARVLHHPSSSTSWL